MLDFASVASRFEQKRREAVWAAQPGVWAEDHDLFLWSKQLEVAQSVVDNEKTLVITGNGVGKSRLSATLAVWWVDVHPLDNTTVVTTATNWKQVRNVLWKEIPRVRDTAGAGGRITANAEWKFDGRQDPVAFGMKPDDKDESGFQGIHDEYVLVVLDEAGGISRELFTAADAVTTNKHARIIAIANPNDPSCYMAEVHKQQMRLPEEDRTWHIIQFGAFDSPNFTGEPVPDHVSSRLVQPSWVEARKKEWGEDDPRYVARVLGKFPSVSDDGLFNMGRVLQSMQMHTEFEIDENAPLSIGVDVARYGSDDSVVASCKGGYVEILGKYQAKTGPELARIVGDHARRLGCRDIRIDGIGVGASVLDAIGAHVLEDTLITDIKGNAASTDSTKWYNYRAAMYDQFSKAVSDGSISLPDDNDLYQQCASIKYKYRGSAMLIESKEDMRKRKVHSPDTLDAVVYAAQDIAALTGADKGPDLFGVDDLLDDEDDWFELPPMFLA